MQTLDDYNLINLSLEDDTLLPPSLNDEFVGFRLSVSERGCCKARLHQDTVGNGNMVETDKGRNEFEPDRKSLTWHTAFMSNEGILDSEELMLFNRGVKKMELQQKAEFKTIVSKSCSMSRVPTKRISTSESVALSKKPRSWLSTKPSFVPMSSSSSGGSSVKNMLKSSITFLKKKVGPGKKTPHASSSPVKLPSETSSKKSKANSVRPAHQGCTSIPKTPTCSQDKLSALPPSTPPEKSSRFYKEGPNLSAQRVSFSSTPPTKETMFGTPSSRPSGLRLPSARFGFFDLDHEQRSSSSKLEETFHNAPKSTPQDTTTSTATKALKKLRCSQLSPVPYLPTPNSHPNDKENKSRTDARVDDDLSKHLDTDLVIDLQGKKEDMQLYTPTDHSATPQLKRAIVAQRTPLAEHNRSLILSASSRY